MKTFEVAAHALEGVEGAVVLSLTGYLDAHTVADFDKHTEEVMAEGVSKLVIDLRGLNYISSAGIGALMGLSQRLKRHSGDLVLMQPTEKVYKILDLLGFTRIFQMSGSEEEARQALLS